MELLLNLAWLLLALPAYWLWRSSRYAATGRRLGSLQRLFSLACLLVILFPVISATDDLRVMRAEMEESPSTKRSACHKSADKAPFSTWHAQPAAISTSNFFATHDEVWHFVATSGFSLPSLPAIARTGRGPPLPFLA
ncbi:MAG TPA: hypothetical protein VKQ11_03210 [Candidatus Sulfotelmatobacter sp.]|nr:hypothetical protein [Candidatus Sulfotelmatobacter sp.]